MSQQTNKTLIINLLYLNLLKLKYHQKKEAKKRKIEVLFEKLKKDIF